MGDKTRIILMGRSAAGKTTLCQCISHEQIRYHKTQTVSIVNQSMIDTPGEYLERRGFRGALMVTAADAAQNSLDRARRWAESGGAAHTPVPWDKETLGYALGRGSCAMAALTDRGLAGVLAEKLVRADVGRRPSLEPLLHENKNGRAQRPAAPET